jgi:tetratricopeptide (TPR) repeat protein
MLMSRTVWRRASLLMAAMSSMMIAPPAAKAQSSDGIETLNERIVEDDDPDTEIRYELDLAADTFGPDNPRRALLLSKLGGLYKSHGRLRKAEPLLKSALEIDERIFGTSHSKIAYDLAQLGDLYRLEGNCDQSEQLFSRARSLGSEAIREVPVLIGTDRKLDASQSSVTFGRDREEKLSFVRAVIAVPASMTTTVDVGSDQQNTGGGLVTKSRRLAMHCIEIVDDKQIVAAAMGQIEVAKNYPNQALIFVHGYNMSFDNAARRAAQIAYDINFDGATFLFSWP